MEEDLKAIQEYIEYDKEHRIVTKFDEKPLFRDRLENLLTRYKQLEEYYEEQNEVNAKFIPKSKLKEFFSSRLEKYQEADDGRYEQDYLTRGELELVDRYKECKEIAKIILEEEVHSEVPQDCIPKSKVKEKIEEIDGNREYLSKFNDWKEKDYTNEDIINNCIDVLEELLREE